MNRFSNWQDWLAAQRASSPMIAEEVGLDKIGPPADFRKPGWLIMAIAGFLRIVRLVNGGETFFSVIGVKVSKGAGREVSSWKQVMLREHGQGAVVLFKIRNRGRIYYLVQAKIEPGNPSGKNCVLIGPSIQATQSNLEQAHGGRRPPFAHLLDTLELEWVTCYGDGGRFMNKRNRFAVIEVGLEFFGTIPPEFYFASVRELREMLREGEAGEYLREVMAFLV